MNFKFNFLDRTGHVHLAFTDKLKPMATNCQCHECTMTLCHVHDVHDIVALVPRQDSPTQSSRL